MIDTSFGNQTFRNDPYPVYAQLRRTDPVAVTHQAISGRSYMLTRYEDVAAGLRDARLSTEITSDMPGLLRFIMPPAFKAFNDNMLSQDDPNHRRLRDLVHKAFTPKRVEQMAGQVAAVSERLLDRMQRGTTVDLIQSYALPLPMTVISEMLGVPEGDRMKFARWSNAFLEIGSGNIRRILLQYPNASAMYNFLKKLIAERRARPGDDLISALIAAEEAGDRLNESELLSMIFLLLLAGHETTVNLIASGTLALLEFPDQLTKLKANPDLMDSAVEELLRYANPVEQASPRIAVEDIEIRGHVIPKGTMVWLAIASANRDETVFPDADKLDIERSPNKHLAFGVGIHYCLGAPLARMEGKIALAALLKRFPDLKLARPARELQWRTSLAVRGLTALPIRLG